MIELMNAKISGTMLGYEDHGILTCSIGLDYGNGGQSFGGYALDGHIKGAQSSSRINSRYGSAYGMEFIRRILAVLEVDKWELLKGTSVRVYAEHCKVHKIGHFLKDQWFDPKEIENYREPERS